MYGVSALFVVRQWPNHHYQEEKREIREERYKCESRHRISLAPNGKGDIGWKIVKLIHQIEKIKMLSITELIRSSSQTVYVLDVSPPRSGNDSITSRVLDLTPDVFSVAYNPGLSVRVNSVMLASWVQNSTGIPTSFFLATRDMNKLALQSLLLGFQLHGLSNITVVQGDAFSETKLKFVKGVNDFTPTEFITAIKNMNFRKDFENKNLIYPTDFCLGATVDLSKDLENEAELLHKKIY